MNDFEYRELERRIADRNRIKAMADDLAKSRKETHAASKSEAMRATARGEKPFRGYAGGLAKIKLPGGSFERIQIEIGG